MCSTVSAALEDALAGAGGLDEEILALVDLRNQVDAALVERVGAFDATEGWAVDGEYSFACWLRARADVSRTESSQLARFARTLRTMAVTEAAVTSGKLSVAKARLLAGVINERTRARFDDHEAFLVEQVQGLDVDQTKIVLAHWKRLADTDGPDPGDPTRNRATITTGIDGRWHLDVDLDHVSGAIVKAALDAIVDRMHHHGRFTHLTPENNTAARRTADGVVEMAHRSTGADPDQGAVDPDVVILVPHARLNEPVPDPFRPAPQLIGTGPLTLTDVCRLALLGTVSTLTLDADGRPLNLGRRHRLATTDQWIALRARDQGCVAPGCDRPAEWCQAHHLQFWEHHGNTDLPNLCLLCSHHHHLVHDQHWTLHRHLDQTWQLTRPDGGRVEPPRYSRDRHPGRPPD